MEGRLDPPAILMREFVGTIRAGFDQRPTEGRSGSSTMRRALTPTMLVAGNGSLRQEKGKRYLKNRLAASLAGIWDDKFERH